MFCFRAQMRLLTYVMLVHLFGEPRYRYIESFTCVTSVNVRNARQNQYVSQPQPLSRSRYQRHDRNSAWSIDSRLYSSSLPDISGMRVGDIRKELESYGISTSSFLEKKDMVMALEKARTEGKTTVNGAAARSSNSTSTNNANNTSASNTTQTVDRSTRIKEEMEKANAMKVGELKKVLVALGVSTASFFEKSEFVKAYAEVVVDGKGKKSGRSTADDEPRDPEYRDVVLQKMVRGDPRQLQGTVIDVTAARKR